MNHRFVAYIDEAGDEGFVFNPDGSGSTKWFVLSALVVRKRNDLQLMHLAREIRSHLRFNPRHTLHFRKLRHEQRIPISRKLGEAHIRTISILIHKPSIQSPETFQAPYSLYRYATRLLLERLSWLCRDHKKTEDDNGPVDLVFSNRSAMSYEKLSAYLHKLKSDPKAEIAWEVIDPDSIRALMHDQLAGLQLVDAVATGTFYAFNPNAYGETEARYLALMAPTLYRNKTRLFGYGLKVWCSDPSEHAKAQNLIQTL